MPTCITHPGRVANGGISVLRFLSSFSIFFSFSFPFPFGLGPEKFLFAPAELDRGLMMS